MRNVYSTFVSADLSQLYKNNAITNKVIEHYIRLYKSFKICDMLIDICIRFYYVFGI
jgi:hypothetical protein